MTPPSQAEKKKENLGVVYAHNNEKGEIHMGDPRRCPECKYQFIKFDAMGKHEN